MVEKGKSMMSREERSHMRHRAHTRSSLAGGKARGRRTSGGQNESSPRILPKPDAYQCTCPPMVPKIPMVLKIRIESKKKILQIRVGHP